MSTYDLHFVFTAGSDPKPVSFGYTAAVAVKGPQKLINRWVKCLLTRKGSDPFDLSIGTAFTDFRSFGIGSPQSLLDALSLIIRDCNQQLRQQDHENPSVPADERLRSARLLRLVDLGAGDYDVWVSVTNATGTTRTLQVPSLSA